MQQSRAAVPLVSFRRRWPSLPTSSIQNSRPDCGRRVGIHATHTCEAIWLRLRSPHLSSPTCIRLVLPSHLISPPLTSPNRIACRPQSALSLRPQLPAGGCLGALPLGVCVWLSLPARGVGGRTDVTMNSKLGRPRRSSRTTMERFAAPVCRPVLALSSFFCRTSLGVLGYELRSFDGRG